MKLLYLFGFSLEQIKKHKFIFCILIILVFSCAFMTNYLLCHIRDFSFEFNFIENFKNRDMIYVSYGNHYEWGSLDTEILNKNDIVSKEIYGKLTSNPDIEIGTLNNYMMNVNKSRYLTYIYNDILVKNTVFYLKKGKQLYEFNENDSKYVPVLMAEENPMLKTHDMGDIITIKTEEFTFDENHKIINTKEYSYEAIIWGIISKPYKYFKHLNSNKMIQNVGDILNMNVTFYNDPYNTDNEFIITPDVTFKDKVKLSELNWNHANVSLCNAIIKATKGSKKYNEVYNELKKEYSVLEFETLLQQSRENYSEGIGDFIYILICLLIISIIGIGSSNIYIAESQKQEYAIYYISGAKWRECLLIDIIRNLPVIILPSIFGSLACILVLEDRVKGFTYQLSFAGFDTVIFITIMMLCIYILSSVYFLIKLKKTQPIEYIRLMDKQ